MPDGSVTNFPCTTEGCTCWFCGPIKTPAQAGAWNLTGRADGDMAEIAGQLAAKYPEAAWDALLAGGAIEQVGWRSAVDGSLWDMRMGGEPFTGDNHQGDTPVYRLTQKTEENADG